jgi:hypothetical protein
MCWMTAAVTELLMLCDPDGREFTFISSTDVNSGAGL